jgi:hypothetical protein
MAVKKKRRRHKHYTGHEEGDAAELSERLAPPEEQDAKAVQPFPTDDTIILDTGKLKISRTLLDEETGRLFHFEPVIVVILFLALAYIAFIAYLIHQMPAPAK